MWQKREEKRGYTLTHRHTPQIYRESERSIRTEIDRRAYKEKASRNAVYIPAAELLIAGHILSMYQSVWRLFMPWLYV